MPYLDLTRETKNRGKTNGIGGVGNGGTLVMIRSSINENSAWDEPGGIWNTGHVLMIDSTILGNRAYPPNSYSHNDCYSPPDAQGTMTGIGRNTVGEGCQLQPVRVRVPMRLREGRR